MKEKLILWYEGYCQEKGIPADLYDIEAKIDSSISFEENQEIIKEELNWFISSGDMLKERHKQVKEEHIKEAMKNPVFSIDLDLTDSIAIIGDRNSGKTNLAFSFMNQYKGKRTKVLYGYPIQKEGYSSVCTWSDLLKLTDSIIFIDEIQKYIRLYDRRANTELMEMLAFLAQNNNTLIFTTQLSQFITKGVEASIQTWCIKQIDVPGLKNGCKIKRILKETAHPRITDKAVAVYVNEYISFDLTMPAGFNGMHSFEDQRVKKDWKTPTKNPTRKPN